MSAKETTVEAKQKIVLVCELYIHSEDEVVPTLNDFKKTVKQVHHCSKCNRPGHKRPTCTYKNATKRSVA